MPCCSDNDVIAPWGGIQRITMASHPKAAFGWYVLLLYPHSTYVSSFGHISTTVPPMDLQLLSLASSDAAACHAVAIMTSLHHGEAYRGLLWRAIQRLLLVGMYYYCTHIQRMYLLLVISQQLYHLWTSNHFHWLPLMQPHAML